MHDARLDEDNLDMLTIIPSLIPTLDLATENDGCMVAPAGARVAAHPCRKALS